MKLTNSTIMNTLRLLNPTDADSIETDNYVLCPACGSTHYIDTHRQRVSCVKDTGGERWINTPTFAFSGDGYNVVKCGCEAKIILQFWSGKLHQLEDNWMGNEHRIETGAVLHTEADIRDMLGLLDKAGLAWCNDIPLSDERMTQMLIDTLENGTAIRLNIHTWERYGEGNWHQGVNFTTVQNEV